MRQIIMIQVYIFFFFELSLSLLFAYFFLSQNFLLSLKTLTELGLHEIYLEKLMHGNENIKALGNKLLSKYWLVK